MLTNNIVFSCTWSCCKHFKEATWLLELSKKECVSFVDSSNAILTSYTHTHTHTHTHKHTHALSASPPEAFTLSFRASIFGPLYLHLFALLIAFRILTSYTCTIFCLCFSLNSYPLTISFIHTFCLTCLYSYRFCFCNSFFCLSFYIPIKFLSLKFLLAIIRSICNVLSATDTFIVE